MSMIFAKLTGSEFDTMVDRGAFDLSKYQTRAFPRICGRRPTSMPRRVFKNIGS